MAVARAAKKEDRLELRLRPSERALLDEAARASSMSTSTFVLSHATAAAQNVLADRTVFVLPPERWEAFLELLDRPEQPVDGLAKFLAGPSVLDLE